MLLSPRSKGLLQKQPLQLFLTTDFTGSSHHKSPLSPKASPYYVNLIKGGDEFPGSFYHSFLIPPFLTLELMKRILLLFLLALLPLALLPVAYSTEFAALTITPAGAEQVDIATGITTLPDGGEVVDAERELTLQSDFIRFEEGKFIETEGTEVTGKFGTLTADALRIDLEQDTITAEGELTLNNQTLSVTADALTLFLEPNVARLAGNVQSAAPEFETEALLLKLDEPDALLVSPYRFQNGPFTLEQSGQDTLLQLHQEKGEDGTEVYNPSTTVSAELLETLEPYLP